jgi:hypothetical protein
MSPTLLPHLFAIGILDWDAMFHEAHLLKAANSSTGTGKLNLGERNSITTDQFTRSHHAEHTDQN